MNLRKHSKILSKITEKVRGKKNVPTKFDFHLVLSFIKRNKENGRMKVIKEMND